MLRFFFSRRLNNVDAIGTGAAISCAMVGAYLAAVIVWFLALFVSIIGEGALAAERRGE